MNKINLLGRVVKDIELTTTQSGTDIAKFTVAVDRPNKKELEEQGKTTSDFFNVVAFGGTARVISNYSGKGLRLLITGRVEINNYQDENKVWKSYTSIICEQVEIVDFRNSNKEKTERADFTPRAEIDEIFKADFDPLEDDRLPF